MLAGLAPVPVPLAETSGDLAQCEVLIYDFIKV
jgi:hypothetical protein